MSQGGGPDSVSLCLLAEEPGAGPWRAERLAVVAADVVRLGHERGADRRPVGLAIEGVGAAWRDSVHWPTWSSGFRPTNGRQAITDNTPPR